MADNDQKQLQFKFKLLLTIFSHLFWVHILEQKHFKENLSR